MPLAGFEPTISAAEQPHTYALDNAATGTGIHLKYSILILESNATWIFSAGFRKILKYKIFYKIRPVAAELFYADGQTDRHDETRSRFSQICEGA